MTALRLCFIVLFGTVSLMHGPIMTFAGVPAVALHEATTDDAAGHADHGGRHDHAPASAQGGCNAFACFLAMEPFLATARPLRAMLFGVMVAAPIRVPHSVKARPDLPPPRILS